MGAQGRCVGRQNTARAILRESYTGLHFRGGVLEARGSEDGCPVGQVASQTWPGQRPPHRGPPWCRGTFYQGYLCTKCGVGAHKECLEVTPPCKISEYRAMSLGGLDTPVPSRQSHRSQPPLAAFLTLAEFAHLPFLTW